MITAILDSFFASRSLVELFLIGSFLAAFVGCVCGVVIGWFARRRVSAREAAAIAAWWDRRVQRAAQNVGRRL